MRDMTQGKAAHHMMVFALPLLLGNIFHQLYNTVDAIAVGQFAGKESLAAVGAATPLMNLMMFLIVGASYGVSVLISEFFGANEREKLRREVTTALLAGIGFTLVLSLFGMTFTRQLLLLLRTPQKILPEATLYLRIVFGGLVCLFLSNIFSASLRAIGDSTAPLVFLILSSLLNVGLDIVMVGNLRMGVRGAALATVFSQLFSAILCIGYIFLRVPILRFGLRDLRIDKTLLSRTVQYSWISALQQCVLHIGRLLVQGAVNPLGVDAIAAFNAVSKIDAFALAPGDAVAMSLTTFVSQNRGAKRTDRLGQGLRTGLWIAGIYCAVLSIGVFLGVDRLMLLFVDSSETTTIAIGVRYLRLLSAFYLFTAPCNCFQGFFRGAGKMDVTLYATFIQIPIRVILTYSLVGRLGMNAVAVGTITGWSAMIAYELFSYRRYRRTELPLLAAEAPVSPQEYTQPPSKQ